MMLSMNKGKDGDWHTFEHASADYLWAESVISVDGMTVHCVYALDTVAGWVQVFDADPMVDRFKTITGVVEYVRLDACDQ